MKKESLTKIITAVIFVFMSIQLSAQWGVNNSNSGTLSSNKEDSVSWDVQVVDLGQLKRFHPADAVFKMTNKGSKPVIIKNAKGECGCTDIDYPKHPIAPGKTVEIIATYDAEEIGTFNKSVTLTLNIEKSKQILRIKGEVLKD